MKQPRAIIEIRPRLQSCQVYYHVEQPANSELFSMDVQPSALTFKCDLSEETFVFENFTLKSIFFNQLKADEGNVITCRLQISHMVDESEPVIHPVKYVPKVLKKTAVPINCRFCHSNLLKQECSFDRILPLPSSDFNSGDFFCHECSSDSYENNHKLDPKISDLLFGNFFFKINSKLLSASKTFLVRNVIYCQQCRTWLGSKEKDAIKFWNCTVTFDPRNNSEVFPKADFLSVVKSVINDSVGTMCKIIITHKAASSSGTEYLLLWVMDRSLPLLISRDGSNKLIKKNVIKLLYSLERSHSSIVSQWEKDINTHSLDVAEIMFAEGLDYLEQSNILFPKMFRQANNMNVGYLGL